jgi:hypothetical protein
VALPERPFVAEIRALTDPRAMLARYARHLAETNARQADVMISLAGAATADPDAAAILAQECRGPPTRDHDTDTAADMLWLAMDVRNYDWLVRQRGWTTEQYQQWYVDTVTAAILNLPQKTK